MQNLIAEYPLLRTYCFYAALLVLKTMAMSILTGMQRFKNKAFINPEDAVGLSPKLKPRIDDDVERVRRAHLNDLENIPIFLFISLIYISTNPAQSFASLLFLIFTVGRYVHTFVYAICVIPQPARAIAWFAGYGVTAYMAFISLVHYSA